MDADALLAGSTASLHGMYGSMTDTHPIGVSSAELRALEGALLGFQLPYEGSPAMAHCSAAPAATGPVYSPSFAKPIGCLLDMAGMAPHVSTPPLSVCSPEFLPMGLAASSSNELAAVAAAAVMGLSYSQPLQIYASLHHGTQAAAAPIEGETFVYPAPIMEPTHFYADAPFGNAGTSAALIPNLVAMAGQGMQINANPQPSLAHSSIPSLLHTPQLGPLADAPNGVLMASPAPAPVPAHILQLHAQGSPSLSEPARSRSSSPSLARLNSMPYASSQARLQRRNTGPMSRAVDAHANSAQVRRIRSHTRTGSDIAAGCAPALAAHHGPSALGHSRTQSAVSMRHDSPAVPDDSSSVGDRDDGGAPTPSRTPSGRQYLDAEQRRVFFRWLYDNAHDPKPKGADRDRLRSVGNMSRERLKTWFANARRRYFKVTFEGDVQHYEINDRFRDVCERENIALDQ
ncbi:hypothetical protein H4R19_003978 [Coemansia spiralis]|nr:hypothetical protein H4R19_003978 [Coemansia spiralis]